jgi:hypothetical protein
LLLNTLSLQAVHLSNLRVKLLLQLCLLGWDLRSLNLWRGYRLGKALVSPMRLLLLLELGLLELHLPLAVDLLFNHIGYCDMRVLLDLKWLEVLLLNVWFSLCNNLLRRASRVGSADRITTWHGVHALNNLISILNTHLVL